jgi:hypothetical protein
MRRRLGNCCRGRKKGFWGRENLRRFDRRGARADTDWAEELAADCREDDEAPELASHLIPIGTLRFQTVEWWQKRKLTNPTVSSLYIKAKTVELPHTLANHGVSADGSEIFGLESHESYLTNVSRLAAPSRSRVPTSTPTARRYS